MKKYLALFLFVLLAATGISIERIKSYEPQAKLATGAIFISNERKFNCSGTEIGHTLSGDGVFLTARHCVADPDTNEIHDRFYVSFSDKQDGPFYDAAPVALSLSDDIALLLIKNGSQIPEVKIVDNRNLRNGDSIFNVSFPLGTGKAVFHGEYLGSRFGLLPQEMISQYPIWLYAMPINLTIAHGSSGSGLFSDRNSALIGVAVGTFGEGSFNIAIPSERVIYFLNDLKDNTVDKFIVANPVKDEPDFF